jgi:hypothetical protein
MAVLITEYAVTDNDLDQKSKDTSMNIGDADTR